MNKNATWAAIAAGAVAIAAAAYWAGQRSAVQYAPVAAAPAPAKSERKILYYRNPMGLPDTSPVPKKDPMGMDYIPVYAGEEPEPAGDARLVKLTTDKVQKLGVRTEAVQERELGRTVLAAGTVQIDERRQATVSPKFEGWIQTLHVNTTGQAVARGQALAEVYSPELVSAQREYLIARSGGQALARATGDALQGVEQLADSAAQRLRNWDITPQQIERLSRDGEVRQTLTLTSPVSGVVIDKPAVQGMRFMPGEVLMRITDLSNVWLIADVFEQDLGWVRVGQSVEVRFNAYPERGFQGKVSFVYPTLSPETRTAKIRVDMPNRDGALKPAMYGTVELAAGSRTRGLTVPDSAVIDSGARRVLLVQRGEGRFEPREVKTGARAGGYVHILEGVAAGEQVVVKANFLIDAESNLKAALGGFGHSHGSTSTTPGAAPAAQSGVTHTGEGTVQAVDAKAGKVTLAHGPIESLKWPAMTMDFTAKDAALLKGLEPGRKVRIELRQGASGDYQIVGIAPAAPAAPAAAPSAAPAETHHHAH